MIANGKSSTRVSGWSSPAIDGNMRDTGCGKGSGIFT
jgi:hypothetical protein